MDSEGGLSQECIKAAAIPMDELMDLDAFGEPMTDGSWTEDCGEMEFSELSPSSSASFFNTPFFSLFSFPSVLNPAEDFQPVQDQVMENNRVKEIEGKSMLKEEQGFESNPMIYCENIASSSKQDHFFRLEGFQDRNTFMKPTTSRGSDFQQTLDSGMVENSFLTYEKEVHMAKLAITDKNAELDNDQMNKTQFFKSDELANERTHLGVNMLGKTVKKSEGSSRVKESIMQALRYIKDSSGNDVLAQVWVPVKRNGKTVLTTYGQPYALDPTNDKLINYRTVSLEYEFPAEEDSDGDLGLPGRVFLRKLPEWTPDVQYYSRKEYLRVIHAQVYNVRGSLALPVFEAENQSCVGVVEIIMTTQKIHYAPEMENIFKALQAVNLRSSKILDHPKFQIHNEGHQAVLSEILEVLTTVCKTNKLPLAQTWIPCSHHNVITNGDEKKGSCICIDGYSSDQVCISTVVEAFYVTDPKISGFQEACTEKHLLKGQGVPGKAFASNQPYFSADITTFSMLEYPLLHYARMFGLRAAVAIRLRSTLTGNDDYVLEFFLPVDCIDFREQQAMLNSLSSTMQHVCRTLRTLSDKELQEDILLEITEGFESGRNNLHVEVHNEGGIKHSIRFPEQEWKQQDSLQQPLENIQKQMMQEPVPKSPASGDYEKQQLCQDRLGIYNQKQHQQDSVHVSNGKFVFKSSGESTSSFPVQENVNIRRRGKIEKNISLKVLQQYFAGSLKDASKSIGVCPTTLKRICRQHGISRWPSRKISKVNRSIRKLQIVIESVQGVDGSFKLGTFANGSFSPTTLSTLHMGNITLIQGNSWTADVKGGTNNMANSPRTHSCEASPSGTTSLGKSCTMPEKLSASKSLMTTGLGTIQASILECEEKRGDHAYHQRSTPEGCALSVEGSFLQVEGGYKKGFDSPRGFTGTPKSSDCSQNSSSSHYCSNEADPNDQVTSNPFASPQTCQGNRQTYYQQGQFSFPVIKRAHSQTLINDKGKGPPARSSSFKCLDSTLNKARNAEDKRKCIQECSQQSPPHLGFSLYPKNTNDPGFELFPLAGRLETGRMNQEEFTVMSIKVTYKEDAVRFKLSPHMGFHELCEEVAKRFLLELGTINLRYLDDESEWVLLTCDADLFECIDIFKSSGGRTIKLLVQDVCPNIGSSCGSTGGL